MAWGGVFYGWHVVVAVFIMMSVSSGLGFYGMAVFLEALTRIHGFSVSAMSGATALMFVVSGVAGLWVAQLISRHDARLTIAGGSLIAAFALALVGRVGELWQVYAVYTLFGLGFSASGLVPGTTLVTRWFHRRRSVALSIASTGLSVGGIVLTPLAAAAIARFGLEAATLGMALAYLVGIVPITALVLRQDPAVLGLQPDGEESQEPSSAGPEGQAYEVAIRTRFFLALTAGYVFMMTAQVGGIAHQFKLVSTRLDPAAGALALSLLAGSSIVGRLAGGWIVTVVPMRGFTIGLTVLQGAALVGLALGDTPLTLFGGTVLFGFAMGNLLMLHPLLIAEAFGVRDYGRIYSMSSLIMTLGVAGGPALIGLVHDLGGGYGPAFQLAALTSLLAVTCLMASGSIEASPQPQLSRKLSSPDEERSRP